MGVAVGAAAGILLIGLMARTWLTLALISGGKPAALPGRSSTNLKQCSNVFRTIPRSVGFIGGIRRAGAVCDRFVTG